VGDLGVGPGVLKKGASDILECLTPVEKVDLKDPAGQATSLGDQSAVDALTAFCSTWELGAGFLTDCAATLAEGLNSANNDFTATDQAIRDAANSVKTDLG
jgi:hypothetical protein